MKTPPRSDDPNPHRWGITFHPLRRLGPGLITGVACPFSPAHLDRGEVYRFNLNHVVQVDDPMEMFRIEYAKIGE